jgi:hypothetical protein
MTAKPENAESIAEAAEYIANMPLVELDEMGRKAKDYYDQHLSLQIGVKHFLDIFKQMATHRI